MLLFNVSNTEVQLGGLKLSPTATYGSKKTQQIKNTHDARTKMLFWIDQLKKKGLPM